MRDRGSNKVVLVLDHGARFAVESCAKVPVMLKIAGGSQNQVGTCEKTLWTWCAESVLEYHRIVSDLYSGGDRLVRVAVADSVGRMLQASWGKELISSKMLNDSLSKVGAPSPSGEDCTPLAGILLAVEALSQRTEKQMAGTDKKVGRPLERYPGQTGEDSIKTTDAPPISNGGSIVVFCSLKSAQELVTLQQEVSDQILNRNNSLINIGDGSYIPIGHVDLYIVNTYPANVEPVVSSSDRKEISANLSCTVISRPAGEQLISVAHSVCLSVYDLVSTTVSGIPMKEEAHQGQSTNYDVELLHSREAHDVLETLKLCGPNGYLADNSRPTPYPTFKLSWSTPSPKNKWNLFPRTLSAMRVSPAAVNSRPSVCLTSFLLGGRNVMLEVKRAGPAEHIKPNVNQKLISHTLIAHGGRIYIHAIDILPNSVLDAKYPKQKPVVWNSDAEDDDEDEKLDTKNFVSIKKADYEDDDDDYKDQNYGNTPRIEEFKALMKECYLRPRRPADKIPSLGPGENIPCALPLRHIRRLTRYWPLWKEDTLIFQQPEKFSELLSLYKKLELSHNQAEDCRKAVYRLTTLKEDKNLFKGTVKSRLVPDPKLKDEVFKIAMIELASYMANYANNSDTHMEILKLMIQVLDLDRIVNFPLTDVPIVEELNEPRAMANMAQSAPNTATSSRSSSPVPKKARKGAGQWSPNETVKVYDFIISRQEAKHPSLGRPDFVGREEAGNRPAQLYKGIDFSNAAPRGEVPI